MLEVDLYKALGAPDSHFGRDRGTLFDGGTLFAGLRSGALLLT
jgi:hypothetical protein